MRIVPAPMRERAAPLAAARHAFGIASLNAALGGGLARGRVHEVYAAEGDDAASAAGFAMALATDMADPDRTVLWLRAGRAARSCGMLQANGWAELGGTPGLGLLGVVPDTMALLRAAVDALRCAALGAVIVEGWGAMRELDLTASRRLALAAEKSGVTLFLLRMDGEPVPSAAQTRWQVASAPSRALPGHAPGWPVFDVTLLRQRSGPCGLNWRLEWDRDQREFREAEISGAVASVPAHGPAADRGADVPCAGSRRAA